MLVAPGTRCAAPRDVRRHRAPPPAAPRRPVRRSTGSPSGMLYAADVRVEPVEEPHPLLRQATAGSCAGRTRATSPDLPALPPDTCSTRAASAADGGRLEQHPHRHRVPSAAPSAPPPGSRPASCHRARRRSSSSPDPLDPEHLGEHRRHNLSRRLSAAPGTPELRRQGQATPYDRASHCC